MNIKKLQYQKDLPPFTTKDELAKEVLGHDNFDTALPQNYLDSLAGDCMKKYDLLRFGLVVLYTDEKWGAIEAITLDAQNLLNKEGAK